MNIELKPLLEDQHQPVNSPLTWLGGKLRMSKHILPRIPQHTLYAELFGGGGWILFQKKRSAGEIYNDINADLVAFFRTIRDRHTNPEHYSKFYNYCKWTPNSRDEFEVVQDWKSETDPAIRAAKWFLNARMVFGTFQSGKSWLVTAARKGTNLRKLVANFDAVAERLLWVQIENKPWEELFDRYDCPETFFYLDPPYLPSTRTGGGYPDELTEQDHEHLIERLKRCEAKVMLSGYPSDLYDSLCTDAGWQREEFDMALTIGSVTGSKNRRVNECLWRNYDINVQYNLF